MQKTVHKKCGFARFLALFLQSAETPLFLQISFNVFAVRALRLVDDRKYTRLLKHDLPVHGRNSKVFSSKITICPETITELIRFEFLRCKNYVTAPEINSPRGPKSPEITVRKSFKSPVRITAPKNNSKTISVM